MGMTMRAAYSVTKTNDISPRSIASCQVTLKQRENENPFLKLRTAYKKDFQYLYLNTELLARKYLAGYNAYLLLCKGIFRLSRVLKSAILDGVYRRTHIFRF
jgi:hypothetical protein